jgi:CRISPR-associated protein Csd2
MTNLEKKIDFAVVIEVKNANPNGDPLDEGRPRVTQDGLGEISDVCLKRKIRNKLMEMGESIFVQSEENKCDEFNSLQSRAKNVLGADLYTEKSLKDKSCKTWFDVRAFGQLFAFPKGKNKEQTVSVGIRGPVSIQPAFSKDPVITESIQITKSVNGVEAEEGKIKGHDTMGKKSRIAYGVYVTYGSIHPQLAEKTNFSQEDADKLKQALIGMFDNDVSASRPSGSISVVKLIWWEHDCKNGQLPSYKVHSSLEIEKKIDNPSCLNDYSIKVNQIENLKCEVF